MTTPFQPIRPKLNSEKLAGLVAKERELQAFADAFPSRREAARREVARRQEEVSAALARLGAAVRRRGAAAAAAATAGGGGGELGRGALAAEAAARRAELEKIGGLGARVAEELQRMETRE